MLRRPSLLSLPVLASPQQAPNPAERTCRSEGNERDYLTRFTHYVARYDAARQHLSVARDGGPASFAT